jgi:hypothetical protein
MSGPFSDTTSPSTALPDPTEQFAALARHLGVSDTETAAPKVQVRLLMLAMQSVLERLDALEKRPGLDVEYTTLADLKADHG